MKNENPDDVWNGRPGLTPTALAQSGPPMDTDINPFGPTPSNPNYEAANAPIDTGLQMGLNTPQFSSI